MTIDQARLGFQREGQHLRTDAGVIGLHIRALREAHGWTQGQLAEHLGTTARRVGVWETQTGGPSAAMITRLCAVFGVSQAELLAGK